MDIKYDITYINNVIYKYLCDENSLSKLVREAMNKAVINGGKRVRPLIMWWKEYRYSTSIYGRNGIYTYF